MSQPVAKEKSNEHLPARASPATRLHRPPSEATAWEAWFGEHGDEPADKGNAVLSDRSVIGETGRVLPLGPHTRQTIQPDPRDLALTPAVLAAAARAR